MLCVSGVDCVGVFVLGVRFVANVLVSGVCGREI